MPGFKIILGIDPGLAAVGYGVIKQTGQKIEALDYGVVKTKKQEDFAQRLLEINQALKKVIKKHKPKCVGVEELFFCKNVKTALKVGQAKGVILLTASQEKVKVMEFTPLQIKETVSGYGKADKQQVQKMVQILLNLKTMPRPDHAADALAAAITCSRYEKSN